MNVVDVLFVAEFQESIRAAIPQIVSLLRPWKSYICEVGVNTLVKLSEQGNVLIFWREDHWLLVVEFRDIIRPAIRQIIALLNHSELKVRKAGADALLELSEQGNISCFWHKHFWCTNTLLVAEFRELTRPAIRQIIALLSHSESRVRRAGAVALSKLSEHGNTSSYLTWTSLMYYYS